MTNKFYIIVLNVAKDYYYLDLKKKRTDFIRQGSFSQLQDVQSKKDDKLVF
jgi:hypothetical protein